LQSQLLLFSKSVVSNEEYIISLKADDTKRLITIEEAGVVSGLFYAQFVNIMGIVGFELVVSGFRYAI
jgi:hypothetical protein